MKRFVLLLAALSIAGPGHAQSDQGWTQKLASDGKSWLWTIEDTEAKGASIVCMCKPERVEIRTREPLLMMAAPDDMKINIGCLSENDKRFQTDGFLAGHHRGVRLGGEEGDAFRSWLKFDVNDERVTLILSGSGQRLIFTFLNRDLAPDDDVFLFDCDMPKKK